MSLLLAALLAVPTGAQVPGGGERMGGGAKRLVAGALLKLPELGFPDSCLAGAIATVNIYKDPRLKTDPPQGRDGYYNHWTFYFNSPEPKPFIVPVDVEDRVGEGPEDPFSPLGRYGLYEHTVNREEFYDKTCITDLSEDSGRAVETAFARGLPVNMSEPYFLHLRYAWSAASPFWREKLLRGKTFWVVEPAEEGIGRSYYVDARSGKFLMKGPRIGRKTVGDLKFRHRESAGNDPTK